MGFLGGVKDFVSDAGGFLGNQLGIGNPGGQALNFDINRSDYNVPQFQQQYDQYGNLANQLGGRRGPTGGTFQASERGPAAFQQGQLANMLMQQANGRGPGQQLVRMQAQDAANQAQANAQGFAARAPGSMGALAGRNAAMAGAQAQSNVGSQAAQAGLQAQLGAMAQAGGVLGQARAQNQNMAQFNAAQQQQGSQFNANAQLQQQQMNQQGQLEALRQRLQLGGMQQQGGMGYWDARIGQAGRQAGIPSFLDKLLMGGSSAMRSASMAGGAPA